MSERALKLAQSFHTLSSRNVTCLADVLAIAHNQSNSHGTRAAACFVMSVWDPRESRENPYINFDLREAWSRWDRDQRLAWQEWAKDPFWV